jgi:signal peptidase II
MSRNVHTLAQGEVMRSWARWLLVSIAVIALDQATKAWVSAVFRDGESLTLTPFFNLVLAYNTGAAFSVFAGAGGWQRPFFITVALVASVTIIYLLRKHAGEQRFSLALSLILGGAMGNLIDRIVSGPVVDFIQVHAGTYYWPAFNVADSAISVGAVLLLWDNFRQPAGPRTRDARDL